MHDAGLWESEAGWLMRIGIASGSLERQFLALRVGQCTSVDAPRSRHWSI
jgi:hypothetical protein